MSPRLTVSVPHPSLLAALRGLPDAPSFDEVEFIEWELDGPAPRPSIDIVVPGYQDVANRLANLAGVTTQLVQSQSIGYDNVVGRLPAGHVLANAATVHETSTAELAVTLTLAAQRGIGDFVRAASAGRWAPDSYPSVADRTVLLLGHGGVNKAVEARLAGFEIGRFLRVASHARVEDGVEIHGLDELPALLPQADIVIIGVPLTDATRGLLGAGELALLPDAALVVNVSRGAVIDAAALEAEAASGRLRFGLDVTDPEPLPEGHPLFGYPNVLISPHVGGATNAMTPRMARLLARQIGHALAGEPFENVVLRS